RSRSFWVLASDGFCSLSAKKVKPLMSSFQGQSSMLRPTTMLLLKFPIIWMSLFLDL
ncbi:hypothetical protein Bca52824_095922, partial [Brassica carinata]